MIKSASIALFASLLTLMSPAISRADLIYTTSSFDGMTDDLTHGNHNVSYVTGAGTTIDSSNNYYATTNHSPLDRGIDGIGLVLTLSPNNPDVVTFTFATPVTEFGLNLVTETAPGTSFTITTATAGQDSLAGPVSFNTSTDTFLGFIDTNGFGSISITFTGADSSSFAISSLVTAVPEPGSLVLCGLAGLSGLIFQVRRRRGAR